MLNTMASFVILLIARAARIACSDRHTYIHTYIHDSSCPLLACSKNILSGLLRHVRERHAPSTVPAWFIRKWELKMCPSCCFFFKDLSRHSKCSGKSRPRVGSSESSCQAEGVGDLEGEEGLAVGPTCDGVGPSPVSVAVESSSSSLLMKDVQRGGKKGGGEIKWKFRRFLDFQWATLLPVQPTPKLYPEGTVIPSDCARCGLLRKVEHHICEGNISRAARLLTSSGLAPDTPDTLARLKAKHPQPSGSIPPL